MGYQSAVVMITGGASGIGLALARRLAKAGARLVLADIDEAGGTRAAQELGQEFIATDVSSASSVAAAVHRTVALHGRLDYLFNNAGIAVLGTVADTPLSDWYRVFDINVRGVVHGIDAAYPLMRDQGFGHIVNTASIAGLIPCPGLVAYSATKHAVVGLSTGLRAEASKHGVKVSVVCPGFVRTPIVDNAAVHGLQSEKIKDSIPWAEPDDVAKEILTGVSKNKAVIVATRHGKVLTQFHRLAPGALRWVSSLRR